MWTIFKKEIFSFLDSWVAYGVIGVFLVSMWLLLWVFPETSFINYGYADMQSFFVMCPYVLIFFLPAVTMRSYAEERKTGTLEILLTAGSPTEVLVIGKYLGILVLYILCLLPTFSYYLTLHILGDGNIDHSQVMGSYLGLFLLGTSFCAMGQLISALFKSQVITFVLSTFLCFVCFFGLEILSTTHNWPGWEKISLSYHYESLGRGVISLSNVSFFLSYSTVFLLLSYYVLQKVRT